MYSWEDASCYLLDVNNMTVAPQHETTLVNFDMRGWGEMRSFMERYALFCCLNLLLNIHEQLVFVSGWTAGRSNPTHCALVNPPVLTVSKTSQTITASAHEKPITQPQHDSWENLQHQLLSSCLSAWRPPKTPLSSVARVQILSPHGIYWRWCPVGVTVPVHLRQHAADL